MCHVASVVVSGYLVNMGTFDNVGQRARASVTMPMLLWSLAMAVALVMLESGGHRSMGLSIATWSTVLFGVWLGWRRRTGVTFFAPLVSWLVAWLPLLLASMVRHGLLHGAVIGLFLDTIGWLAIGTTEFLGLIVVAGIVRGLRGRPREADVVIIDPPIR